MTTETITAAIEALRLRVLVAALGEASQTPWWRTKYLSPTGIRHLERLFPRSSFQAAVRAVTNAARTLHDAGIGKGDVYHLFRLPLAMERQVEMLLADRQVKGTFQDLITGLGNPSAILGLLEDMAGKTTGKHQGPVRVPNAPAGAADTYSRMAGIYLDGFRRGERVFPYAENE